MTWSLPFSLALNTAIALAVLLCPVSSLQLVVAEKPEQELTDARKLELSLAGRNEFPRAYRIRAFEPVGQIDAVGRLVTIDGKVYFKTADQSYIPASRRFPYPELLFELHLSENYAYRPLIEQGIVRKRQVLHEGPIHIQGNWAYERPYHIFGVVWVDKVSKVETCPESDWASWLKSRNNQQRAAPRQPDKRMP